jgi:peroxiredoxin
MSGWKTLALTLLSLLLPLAFGPPAAALEVGEKAPPFANPDLQQKHVLSRDLLGKGWVLLDFFATDCEACQRELPELERLAGELADRKLRVVVLAVDPQGAEVVVPWFREHPTGLTVLLDRYRTVVQRYGVSDIPSLFLVDPAGVIAFKQVGYREGAVEAIHALVDQGR